MIIRPAMIVGGQIPRRIEPLVWSCVVKSDDPTLVTYSDEEGAIARTALEDKGSQIHEIYVRFAFPMEGPTLWLEFDGSAMPATFAQVCDALGNDITAGTVEIFALTEDFDHKTLCWNNKPATNSANLVASVVHSGLVIDANAEALRTQRSSRLDMSALGTVYGLCIKARVVGGPAGSLISYTPTELVYYSTTPRRTATISQRSSDSSGIPDKRTLIFATGHGIPDTMNASYVIVSGMTGANAAEYNGFYASATVIDANTLELDYLGPGTFDETLTDSDGRIEYL